MHPAPAFAWNDAPAMLAFVAATSWARLFAPTPAGLRVVHAPVAVTASGAIRFHIAKANAMAPHLDGSAVLAVIEGPHAYVSGDWMPDRASAVPSWNYVAVECEGVATVLDRADLVALLDDLARVLEPGVGQSWTRSGLDPLRFAAMLDAITGYELAVTDVRGTRKLSQNKPAATIAGVLAGMEARGEFATAAAMRSVRGAERT